MAGTDVSPAWGRKERRAVVGSRAFSSVRIGFISLACIGLTPLALHGASIPNQPGRDSALSLAPGKLAVPSVRLRGAYGNMPLHFEPNQGQADPQVRFLVRGSGYTMFLTDTESVMVLRGPAPRQRFHGRRMPFEEQQPAPEPTVLRMRLSGAAHPKRVSGGKPSAGVVNYFLGNDPRKWRSNVPTYGSVRYEGVYPGVDLVYYGSQRQLECDFVVAPGADPGKIRLAISGAPDIRLDGHGDLIFGVGTGQVRMQRPEIYQSIDGGKRQVAGGFLITGEGQLAFQVAKYDRSKSLIIDPTISYATYVGGTGYDTAYGIAVDSTGNAYITGETASANFPVANGYQPSFGGASDAFVTKLNASGTDFVYSTYVGGSGQEGYGYAYYGGIAVDSAGSAYVAGLTESVNFPTTPGAFQPAWGGGGSCGSGAGSVCPDAFVFKLSPSGSSLTYSTYLGGSGADGASGIAIDSSGNAYVTGYTLSADFPMSPGAPQTYGNAFLTKLDPSGSAAVYSIRLAGSGQGLGADEGFAVAVDSSGNAYVTGQTNSGNVAVISAVQTSNNGGTADAFVTKVNAAGTAFLYSTYLGGVGWDWGAGIAVDGDGNAYVAGGDVLERFSDYRWGI
jgi:hypothetical protein